MPQDESGPIAALSALLGYVGAEAATTAPFEQLFWPQRHLSSFSWSDVPAAVLLLPMGGPLHKAALSTFDTLHRHGIFKGARQGHMLGTAFFPDTNWSYIMYERGEAGEPKELRNCIWATAMGLIDVSELRESHVKRIADARKKREWVEEGLTSTPATIKDDHSARAHYSTFHLRFSRATADDLSSSSLPFIREDIKTPGSRAMLALVAAESSAIIMALVLATAWKTTWAAMWLAPLLLRLLGSMTVVNREPLQAGEGCSEDRGIKGVSNIQEPSCDFEVLCPQSNGDFIILSGPPSIIQQFMRHYGHPIRSRPRELIQLVIVIAMGCVFPAGLVVSSLFMPPRLQYAWFGYQIFLVAGMHVARYSRRPRLLSTGGAIVRGLVCNQDPLIGSSVLFGHERRPDARTLRVDLKVTCHARHAEGKKFARDLLQSRLAA